MSEENVQEKEIEVDVNVKVHEKEIVVPGQVLAEDMGIIPGTNTFREGNKVIAKKIGIADVKGRVVKIIPLSGRYIPQKYDELIGVVLETSSNGWQINIGAPYQAYLPVSEYSKRFLDTKKTDPMDLMKNGDLIYCKIIKYTKTKSLLVSTKYSNPRKLEGGIVIEITPQKIPRIIGKQGSMISLLRKETKTNILAGPNGWIWINGENPNDEIRALKVIRFIEANSHKSGLTEKVEALLKEGEQ